MGLNRYAENDHKFLVTEPDLQLTFGDDRLSNSKIRIIRYMGSNYPTTRIVNDIIKKCTIRIYCNKNH
jgi:hypothetical protein